MKKNVLLPLFGFFVLFSCAPEKNTTIFGTVTGLKKGTLYLGKIADTAWVTIDSLTINGDPEFAFSTQLEEPEVLYLFLKKTEKDVVSDNLVFFAEPGSITISTSLQNFETDAAIAGSENQRKWEDYKKLMQRYTNKNLDLVEANFEARKNQDSVKMAALEKQKDKLFRSKYLATVNFALQNSDYEIAPYLALTEIYDANVKYLDTIHQSLSNKVKNGLYGKELQHYIKEKKAAE